MRRKNIESNIESKFREWVSTINDPKVRSLVLHGTIVTGGCITSMLLDEKVHDYDIYFKDKNTALRVAQYYAKEYGGKFDRSFEIVDCAEVSEDYRLGMSGLVNSSRIYIRVDDNIISTYGPTPSDIENKVEYLPNVVTCNAITLNNGIQLIIRFYGEVHEIHSNFDFVHARCSWTSWDRKLTLPGDSLEAILAKQLIYIGSKYPFSSIVRTRKFINRDWNISAGEYLKMAFQISKIDLTNINVLADQLVGVDAAYFYDLIYTVEDDLKNNNSLDIDHTYINSIIDKIFN